MYCPSDFQENRLHEMTRLIAQWPLATIICDTPSGLEANHIPLIYQGMVSRQDAVSGPGKFIGHVAKSNPLWRVSAEQKLLVVFHGPSSYISPNWYATKHETGKVVPTWNYTVVHASCTLEAIHDPQRILAIVSQLTDHQESSQSSPWRISDAPAEFTEALIGQIVGIELKIEHMQGKWKVSQNQPTQNQASVMLALQSEGADAQTQMALVMAANQTQAGSD